MPARATVRCLLAVLLVVAALAGATTTAAAGEHPRPGRHPELNWMGSTVRKHEPGVAVPVPATALAAASVEGVDVSSHQGNVNWSALKNDGVRFAYVKATEGNYYSNPYFGRQYNGSYGAGMIRGAYHFATPDDSSGPTQANYFVNRGGGWSRDGRTLPGVLDIEYNPYGSTCYGKSKSAMVSWIRDFSTTYRSRTGRYPVIYTTVNWWKQCTGNYSGFGANNPLWLARYGSTPGEIPAGWSYQTFWQYTSEGPIVGDHNKFNGTYERLKVMATG
ncbi:lysozyme [Streptomyces pathocidini]|uniref:lysozyme n=1 Tax=Streptomyces pathocidini TaxID=1650571 RepID=UPI0033C3FE4C